MNNLKNKKMILVIMSFLFLSYTNATNQTNGNITRFDSGFSLHQDTIFVDVKGEMTHALKYQNKYYVLFKQQILKYGGYGRRWLYIFSGGKIEKIVDFPEKLKTVYLDFYVKNDSIILKPYMEKQIYFLDIQNSAWIEIDKTDDLIFEDEEYQVYSLDFGEWGGKTWFVDKESGIQYLIEATTPLVNKIQSIYYLTNSFRVLKIESPYKLNKCYDDITYENIKTSGRCYDWYGKPIGFEVVYEDKPADYYYFDFSYHPRIVTSFVWEDELLHIYETDTAVYVATIENNSIKPIKKIGENMSFYKWTDSYRCRNLNGNNELLKFRTENEQLFGLMEIIDDEVFVHYIANIAELKPKPCGSAKADTIFMKRLDLILSHFHDLKLQNIDLIEQKWGTFDITPERWETSKSYLIEEDSLISNSIHYLATETNNLKRITFEWDEPNFMNWHLEELTKERFVEKLGFLENYITQKIGKSTGKKSRGYFDVTVWE
ncbi:hypothetical protein LJC68_09840, partial [Bacteroidales bacterium OttesenSCG-928-B11]|nr:hypothetical protein [Bacteroidales bacterium OttesenSCG-928-B11]MDL2326904.1 hypothetical protein [Bacteroidales bacterium OttesenSCG-928-A14]